MIPKIDKSTKIRLCLGGKGIAYEGLSDNTPEILARTFAEVKATTGDSRYMSINYEQVVQQYDFQLGRLEPSVRMTNPPPGAIEFSPRATLSVLTETSLYSDRPSETCKNCEINKTCVADGHTDLVSKCKDAFISGLIKTAMQFSDKIKTN